MELSKILDLEELRYLLTEFIPIIIMPLLFFATSGILYLNLKEFVLF